MATILRDTRWEVDSFSSIPQRGILDYVRYVTWDAMPTKAEVEYARQWLESDNPGHTRVSARPVVGTSHTWRFETTFDSSD